MCTIAVMSAVADMSSDVMWYDGPITLCDLSWPTRIKSGEETPLQFGLRAKLVFRWGEGKQQIYLT